MIKNIEVYSGIAGENPAPIVAFNLMNTHSEKVAEVLSSEYAVAVRAGYHCAYLSHSNFHTQEYGVVRISPGWFNTKKDIKNLVFYLNKIAKRNNL